jgi:uncharacterized protein (DUF58 family)
VEGYLETSDTLNSRQFYIAIKRLADSLSYGTDLSPFLGSGLEFAQSRPYHFGDPIKSIDWRVTARTGRLFVKEYQTPKRMPCYLLIDTSASMTISSTKQSKYATAMFIAGGLALACLERVSPVAFLAVGGSELRTDPTLSKQQVMQALLHFRRYKYDEPTSVGHRIAELSPRLKSRALVIVLSDMYDERAVPSLQLLAQSHDCVVLQLRDPAERDLKGAGFFRAQEAETGHVMVSHGRRKLLQPDTVEREMKRSGIDHMLIETDRPYAHRLRYFFESRGLLGRGAR